MDYIPLSFPKMFDTPEIKILITKFCLDKGFESKKLFLNSSPEFIELIERIDTFRSYKSSNFRYLEATKIIYRFIERNSEIVIPQKILKNINQTYTNCSEINCPITLFDEIQLAVFESLEDSIFESFLKSDLWVNYLDENPEIVSEIFLEKDVERTSQKPHKLMNRLEFSSSTSITDAGSNPLGFIFLDFFNYFNLILDDYWTELDKQQSFTICISKEKIKCKNSNLYLIRETGLRQKKYKRYCDFHNFKN
jgi:hypothetical protein